MVGYVRPYSYDYFPDWNGTTYDNFAKQLLESYLIEYKKVTYKHRRK